MLQRDRLLRQWEVLYQTMLQVTKQTSQVFARQGTEKKLT